MSTRLPVPNVPANVADQTTRRWMYDMVRWAEAFDQAVPLQPTLSVLPYSIASTPGKMRQALGVPILVPDYPSGSSIVIWDGTNFQVFTTAGIFT